MKKADEILKQILKNINVHNDIPAPSFFNSWEKIAGIDIANHSELEEIRNNILYISVDHQGWIQIILLKKQNILKAVRTLFPELNIQNLRVFYKKHQLTE